MAQRNSMGISKDFMGRNRRGRPISRQRTNSTIQPSQTNARQGNLPPAARAPRVHPRLSPGDSQSRSQSSSHGSRGPEAPPFGRGTQKLRQGTHRATGPPLRHECRGQKLRRVPRVPRRSHLGENVILITGHLGRGATVGITSAVPTTVHIPLLPRFAPSSSFFAPGRFLARR